MGLFGKKKNKNLEENYNETPTEERGNDAGDFAGFVLLSAPEWDKEQFLKEFKSDWGLNIVEVKDKDDPKDGLVYGDVNGMTIMMGLIEGPVPNEEAEHFAAANYMWKEAVDVVKTHKAQLIVSILSKSSDLISKGKLFTKLASSALKQKNAIAFYNEGAVYEPDFYIQAAELIKADDSIPVLNLVWFGLYADDKKAGIYTYGMRRFAKEEMEVYVDREKADLNSIRSFLVNIVCYILSDDVVLRDGETLGFTPEQKIPITLSPGIAVYGNTLKFDYFEE